MKTSNPCITKAGCWAAVAAAWMACVTCIPLVSAQEIPPATGLEMSNPSDLLLVVIVRPHAIKHGITPGLLQASVQTQLAAAGIRSTNVASQTRLEVEANADSTGTNFHLGLSFRRPAAFDAGGRSFSVNAVTWERSMLFSFNQQTNVVVAVSEMLVREFLADHKKANPSISMRGRVMATDPKFLFVIFNLGLQDGVKEGSEFVVERKGETVAVIKVSTVNTDYSIGNIQKTPAPGEVFEGDVVVPRR